MKTTVIEIKTKQLQFPLIAKCLLSNVIVLFTSENKSIVIGTQPNKPGASYDYSLYYNDTIWANLTDKTIWALIKEIELEFKSNPIGYPRDIDNNHTDMIGLLNALSECTIFNIDSLAAKQNHISNQDLWKTLDSVKIKFTDDKNF